MNLNEASQWAFEISKKRNQYKDDGSDVMRCLKHCAGEIAEATQAIDNYQSCVCEETEKQIRDCIMKNKEVLCIDLFQTRMFGNKIYADIEIGVDGSYTLQKAHEIAEAVHDDIEQDFPKVKHIMVHVNPAETD